MKKQLLLCLFVLYVTGCATAPDHVFRLSSQSTTLGKPASEFCKVHYANGDEKTIDGKYYVAQTEDLLKNKGITIIKDGT